MVITVVFVSIFHLNIESLQPAIIRIFAAGYPQQQQQQPGQMQPLQQQPGMIMQQGQQRPMGGGESFIYSPYLYCDWRFVGCFVGVWNCSLSIVSFDRIRR